MNINNTAGIKPGRIVAALQRIINLQFDFRGLWKWLILGGVLGILVGIAAIVFQMSLEAVSMLSFKSIVGLELHHPGGEQPLFDYPMAETARPWLLICLPALGAFVAGLIVFKFAPEAKGHGTDAAIDAFHNKHGKIRSQVPFVKMVASVITMGTGGSGGREGPVAQIGAGIGSYLADRLGLNARTRRLLLAAGIAAGVGAIFRAPLAGAIFAAEILYSGPEMESEVILPAAVASITGYSVFGAKYGYEHMFTNVGGFGFSNPLELGPYLILAIVAALGALLYVRTFYGVSALFSKLNVPRVLKPLIGGLLTGMAGFCIYVFSGDIHTLDIMSTGYGVLQEILAGDGMSVSLTVLIIIICGKILTTSFTIGSGGSAGVFGPSMVIGGALGAAVGQVMHYFMPGLVQYPSTFAIVGMAGFFTAAANTPISTLVMVSELTGNYELLVPSMWVCSLSFLVGRRWSIYRSQVPSRLHSPAHFGEGAAEILAVASVSDVYKTTRKYVSIPEEMKLPDVFNLTAETRQRIFPVYDAEESIIGCFSLHDLTYALHHDPSQSRSMKARDLITAGMLTVSVEDSVQKALSMMSFNHVEELLVTPDRNSRKVVGIITNADIMLYYNRSLSSIKLGSSEADYRGEAEANTTEKV